MDLQNNDLLISLEGSSDVASWINDHLEGGSGELVELTELDKRVGNLATRLEILYQDISNDLEQTLDSTSRAIPRIAFDLQFMRESALSLQSAIGKTHVDRINGDASDNDVDTTLDRLCELDTVKKNMTAARHILRETENWNTLEFEVTNYIHISDIPSFRKAAARLAEAETSMSLFQDTAEHEPRKALVTSLANQLEASLSASLVAAVNALDVPACREYHEIFLQIHRETEFRSYYNGTRREGVIKLWSKAKIRDCGDSDGTEEYLPFLRRFLSAIESLIAEEKDVHLAIFPRPLESLATFVQAIFDSLAPSLSQRLQQFSSTRGGTGLLGLIEGYTLVQSFVGTISKIMEKIAFLSSLNAPDSNPEKQLQNEASAKSRRLSKRMSISRRTFSSVVPIFLSEQVGGITWEAAVLEPFLDYQSDFARLEKAYLEYVLTSAIPEYYSHQGDLLVEKERRFRERSVDLLAAAEDSPDRCMALTSGYGAVGLIDAVDQILQTFLLSGDSLITSNHVGTSRAVERDNSFEDSDYTAQDWESIQTSLRLLQVSRTIFARMQALDNKLQTFVIQVRGAVNETQRTPRRPGTKRADVQLLSQSTLNSMELQTLFESADAPFPGDSTVLRWLRLSRQSMIQFTKRSQSSLSDTILSPLYSHLSTYAAMSLWVQGSEASQRPGDLLMPTFSVSPTRNMERVAEGLFNLPRLFEVHVDDDSLAFFIGFLPHVTLDHRDSDGMHVVEGPVSPRLSTPPMQHLQPVPESLLTPDQVTATWLSSLTLTLLEHFTSEILPRIKALSPRGNSQLSADLEYLSNTVQALTVESRELESWREYVQMDDETGKLLVKSGDKGGDVVLTCVASLRGWR